MDTTTPSDQFTKSSSSTNKTKANASANLLVEQPKPTREGYAYSFGSPFAFALLLTGIVIYRSTGRQIIPNVTINNPIREFQIMYCAVLSSFVLWNHSQHSRFFTWFSNPHFSFGQKRGLGHHPVPLFGCVPVPHLSTNQFEIVGYSFVGSLALSCVNLAPRFFIGSSLILYFTYFSQLWCETKAGGHGSLTIAPVLFVLSLSPDLVASSTNVSTWPLRLIQMTLCVQYFASGVCKVGASFVIGRSWCAASVLQYYLYDAMWSRPGGEWSQKFMSYLIRTPWLCTLSAISAISFEIMGGMIMFVTNPMYIVGYAVFGIMFHAGVWIIQGLDFTSYWSPIFLSFILYTNVNLNGNLNGNLNVNNNTMSTNGMNSSVSIDSIDSFDSIDPSQWVYELYADASNTDSPMLMCCGIGCLMYGIGQCFVALTFWDIHQKELLPWTCCPMFLLPLNIFDPAQRKHSKRRRSNVAVIFVRIIFISAFLFYRLLLNHSFQTNPNSVTNCF